MTVNIIEPIDRTDDEILKFFFEQVIIGNGINFVKKYFNADDYIKVEELWNKALQMELDMIKDMRKSNTNSQDGDNICHFN